MLKKLTYAVMAISICSLYPTTSFAAPNAYNYQIVGQSSYPAQLKAGETTSVWIDLKNTGTKTWDNNVRLGSGSALYAGRNNDYASEFRDSSWPSSNRAASIDRATVRPGETARFQFTIKAPASGGTYKAYFTPVADGVSWMKDSGIYWQITVSGGSSASGFQKISSEADFKNYLIASSQQKEIVSAPTAIPSPAPTPGLAPDSVMRTSETNVQVAGIDEPDMVKVKGENILYSRQGFYYPYRSVGGILPPVGQQQNWTKIIDGFPVSEMNLKKTIDRGGELLLTSDQKTLMVFDATYGKGAIIAYDITDISSPSQKWIIELQDDTHTQTARLYNDKLYLVTKKSIYTGSPCQVVPIALNGTSMPIICTDIYRPSAQTATDTLYTAMTINPNSNGSVEKKISFLGSYSDSTVYMSENALYISYSATAPYASFYVDFILNQARDLLPADRIAHLEKVKDYDISDVAKQTEFDYTIDQHLATLPADDQNKFRNDLDNRRKTYIEQESRRLETTSIAKISLSDFALTSTGTVPGYLLNQFSLDEYQGNLRVATTVGGRFSWGVTTKNDVYVLNSAMSQIGSVRDLGKTERIYSARFVGDKGYLVTFRQIDPFYVLDLSSPTAPKVAGELKIPGFSSYLHPIAGTNLVIGIGQESNQVKVSLFDVSNPANPVEKDKYLLNDYWTEVSNNHHAFLLDSKHKVFFLPGGQGGYVLSYEDDKLTLKKATTETGVKRAVYINDTMYIISDSKITAYDELTWEKAGELGL